MTTSDLLDYDLVFSGPRSGATSSRDAVRPLRIDACYLFDAHALLARQLARGAKVDIASSVLAQEWEQAEVYRTNRSELIELSEEDAALLRLFGG